MKHEILLGLTTTPASDWRGKVEEMKKFGIKRIALFPTFLDIEERKDLYALLEQIEGLEIPHVHLRHQDFEPWEMKMFESKYKTQLYNVHPNIKLNAQIEKFSSQIYVENMFNLIEDGYLEKFAGLCLDTEHFHRSKIQAPRAYRQIAELMDKFKVGCCHISPQRKNKNIIKRVLLGAWRHYLLSMDEIDYVIEYKKYLPEFISLELENSFAQQLEVKKYIEKNILS